MYDYKDLTGNTVNDLRMVAEEPGDWPEDICDYIIENSKDGYDAKSCETRLSLYKAAIERQPDISNTLYKDLIRMVMELHFDDIEDIRSIDEPCYFELDKKIYDDMYIRIREPFYLYYAGYGQYLFALGNREQAKIYFDKAYMLNPYSPEAVMGLTSYYLEVGELESIFELNKEALMYAYDLEYISLLYQNIGYYALITFNDELASACFSMFIDLSSDSDNAFLMVKDIMPKMEILNDTSSQKILDKYGVTHTFNTDFYAYMYELGMNFYQEGKIEEAKYFLTIFSFMYNDDDVNKLIDSLYKEE